MPQPDRRPALSASFSNAARIVQAVRPDQLERPTPCPDFDLQKLLDHLVGAARQVAALGRGDGSAGSAFPHVVLAEAPGELVRAGEESAEAWSDDARLAAEVPMPWGESYLGSMVVDMYLSEIAAHTWDLACSAGQLDALDRTLGSDVLAAARSMLRPEFRNAMGPGNPFGDEVEPPPDADDWERFAAFMGRQPRG